jgi:hypothetical protein
MRGLDEAPRRCARTAAPYAQHTALRDSASSRWFSAESCGGGFQLLTSGRIMGAVGRGLSRMP